MRERESKRRKREERRGEEGKTKNVSLGVVWWLFLLGFWFCVWLLCVWGWWLFEGVVVKNKTKGEKFEPKESRERNERELVGLWLVGCCELDTRCGGGGPFVF